MKNYEKKCPKRLKNAEKHYIMQTNFFEQKQGVIEYEGQSYNYEGKQNDRG